MSQNVSLIDGFAALLGLTHPQNSLLLAAMPVDTIDFRHHFGC